MNLNLTSAEQWQSIIAMVLYIVVVLVVGVIFMKRANKSSGDFFLGGRKLGPWVAAMSAEASDMSGWLLLGLPGLVYFAGVSEAAWTAIGLAIGTYLNWLIVSKRLRKYSAKVHAITLPEFFSNRFHDTKHVVSSIAALIILAFFSIYVGSCFATCGKLFHLMFNFDYFTMMVVGAVFVFAYTLLGGFLAESTTDFIQGTLMFFALLIVMIGGVVHVGGIDNVVSALQGYDGYFDLFGITSSQVVDGALVYGDATSRLTSTGIVGILSLLAWGLGYFGMPQVLLRFMAIRKPSELRKSRVIAIVWCVISMAAAIFIGVIGHAMVETSGLFTTSSSAEYIFINMAFVLLPPFVAGIIVSGVLAAAMSSADSYMLITASAVSKDFFKNVVKKDASEKSVLWVARITMCVLLLFGILIASDQNSVIFRIVSYAWAGFGACFGPLVLFSLFWRRTNKQGAIAGMVVGLVTVLVWHNWIVGFGGIWAIYELLPGFVFSSLAIVIASLLTAPPDKSITDEFDTYLQWEDPVEGEEQAARS